MGGIHALGAGGKGAESGAERGRTDRRIACADGRHQQGRRRGKRCTDRKEGGTARDARQDGAFDGAVGADIRGERGHSGSRRGGDRREDRRRIRAGHPRKRRGRRGRCARIRAYLHEHGRLAEKNRKQQAVLGVRAAERERIRLFRHERCNKRDAREREKERE